MPVFRGKLMSKGQITARLKRKVNLNVIRTAVVTTLREIAPDKIARHDREACFAEAADRIFDILKNELFEETSAAVSDQDHPVSDSEGLEDFDRIVKQVVEDVRIGYVSSNLQMMKALGSAIAERDTGDSEHNLKVTLYAVRLAEAIELPESRIQALIKGSFLHDIGKISIADNILLKPAELTPREIDTMHQHVLRGAEILKEVKWLDDAHDVVRYHHEQWDGNGYMEGLKGKAIPLNARIFAVGDVFDAMSSERPYKPPYSYEDALDYVKGKSGTHFDPELVDQFVKISRDLYDKIACRDKEELDRLIHEMLQSYFAIDLADTRLRSKYSIL